MQKNSQLIALVDSNDKVIDFAEKQYVHDKGLLHRAFSILVFNDNNEILLHQRALNKYHTPGLWTNTCCSHLLKGMSMDECTHDRLKFEMGFDCELIFQFSFTYKIEFENGLTEHETDHVYFGKWNGTPSPNTNEAMAYKWIKPQKLIDDAKANPDNYTYWFKQILNNFAHKILAFSS